MQAGFPRLPNRGHIEASRPRRPAKRWPHFRGNPTVASLKPGDLTDGPTRATSPPANPSADATETTPPSDAMTRWEAYLSDLFGVDLR